MSEAKELVDGGEVFCELEAIVNVMGDLLEGCQGGVNVQPLFQVGEVGVEAAVLGAAASFGGRRWLFDLAYWVVDWGVGGDFGFGLVLLRGRVVARVRVWVDYHDRRVDGETFEGGVHFLGDVDFGFFLTGLDIEPDM